MEGRKKLNKTQKVILGMTGLFLALVFGTNIFGEKPTTTTSTASTTAPEQQVKTDDTKQNQQAADDAANKTYLDDVLHALMTTGVDAQDIGQMVTTVPGTMSYSDFADYLGDTIDKSNSWVTSIEADKPTTPELIKSRDSYLKALRGVSEGYTNVQLGAKASSTSKIIAGMNKEIDATNSAFTIAKGLKAQMDSYGVALTEQEKGFYSRIKF